MQRPHGKLQGKPGIFRMGNEPETPFQPERIFPEQRGHFRRRGLLFQFPVQEGFLPQRKGGLPGEPWGKTKLVAVFEQVKMLIRNHAG